MGTTFRILCRFDPLEPRLLLSTTYLVTTAADSGPGSLRQAILDSNSNPGADTINFAIGSGTATIAPASALPEFTDPITLDGTSQPGYAGSPIIEISGASAGQAEGLVFHGGSSTIKGLVVNRFQGTGIIVKDNGNNVFENNFIGTDLSGLVKQGNAIHGMLIMCNNNRIGGTAAAQRNVISGNGVMGLFLLLASDNIVQGNYVGIGADGLTPVGNMTGVDTQEGGGNVFGGTAPGAGNVISGNTLDGLLIYSSSNYNTVQGNLVGTDSTGTKAVANGDWGIECQGGHNLIGGTIPAARNILSGNGDDGIVFYLNTAQFNLLQGNFIGTDITGTKALGNAVHGVSFSGDTDVNLTAPGPVSNTIGGTTPAERNIISGNKAGVGIYGRTHGNTISGNWIGTDVTGTAAIPNETGINIFNDSSGNTIGGTAPGAGNVIANCLIDGMNIGNGSHDTVIQGNLFGTDPTGTIAMPNQAHAILSIFVNHTVVGGNTPAARNVIANSGDCAVKLLAGAEHVVQNNYIGTDITGAAAMGNTTAGVWIDGSALSTVSQNIIANSGQYGVNVAGDGTGNRISANSIYNSGGLGIDLGGDGVTPNAAGARTGPNNLQNYPVLTFAASDGARTAISGTLNSTPGATFTVEFFSNPVADATGYGEGQSYLGSTPLTTDGSGNGVFNVTLGVATPAGRVITATATAPDGSTSEFSLARAVVAAPAVTNSSLAWLTRPHQLVFNFSQDVSASLDSTDISIRPLAGGPEIAPASFTYDPAAGALRVTLPDLPNGDYRATLRKEGVTNASGVAMLADASLDFFELLGDANRDRAVDFIDLVAVAQNYGTSAGATWPMGDFNGDGAVDFIDLVAVAQNYNTSLPAPVPSAPALSPALAAPIAPMDNPPSLSATSGLSADDPEAAAPSPAARSARLDPVGPAPTLAVTSRPARPAHSASRSGKSFAGWATGRPAPLPSRGPAVAPLAPAGRAVGTPVVVPPRSPFADHPIRRPKDALW